MHGLIFKIKESHRQDQSESFVIYVERASTSKRAMTILLLFHNKSNEITSLWPVLILSFTYTNDYVCSDMRCFIETKQNQPTSWNKYIPVLDATHLQAFKPKRSTYDQLVETDQQDTREDVCISWNIFNRIHFFAICDVWHASCSFSCDMRYDRIENWRSSFD